MSSCLPLNIVLRMMSATQCQRTKCQRFNIQCESSGAKAENEASTLIDAFRNNASQESASAAKITASNSSPSDSARKYPKQKALKDIQLPHEGKGNCKDNASEGSG